ncbi:MAG: DUF4058 family protein [Anaerolineae bacterium]
MNEDVKLLQPFPGMDPYLEAPDIWPDFHDALAATIRAHLNASLPAPYYARLQKRPELGVALEGGVLRHIIPDVTVLRRPQPETLTEPATGTGVAVLELPRVEATAGVEVRVYTDPFQHRLVEIYDAEREHRLVTVIEIVSPSNKRPGPDRRVYETKQRDVLDSDVNLIELDLLRSGRRLLPYPDLVAAVQALSPDYLVLLNRSTLRQGNWMDYVLYPIRLREPLPCIPVPLAGQDPDVLLDLQVAANRVYREGPYIRAIDYCDPPDPPLNEADAAWAGELLCTAGLRAPS